MRLYPTSKRPKHDIKVAAFEVEFEEVFHLKEMYKTVHQWVSEWGYGSLGGIGEKEKLYMELVGDGGMKNHHIWWRLQRLDGSGYFKNYLKIDFQTLAMSSIEIMHKGKKAKTNKGDFIIRVEGWLMLDYKDEWVNHWFLKYFDNWFVTRWYKNKIEEQKKAFWFEIYNLEDTIKQYLEINTPYDKPQPFHPTKGLA